MSNYPILIFWSDEDGAYIADVPDLRHCSAHGETPEEALREIQVAMVAWLEVARETGKAIPPPTLRPGLCAVDEAAPDRISVRRCLAGAHKNEVTAEPPAEHWPPGLYRHD